MIPDLDWAARADQCSASGPAPAAATSSAGRAKRVAIALEKGRRMFAPGYVALSRYLEVNAGGYVEGCPNCCEVPYSVDAEKPRVMRRA